MSNKKIVYSIVLIATSFIIIENKAGLWSTIKRTGGHAIGRVKSGLTSTASRSTQVIKRKTNKYSLNPRKLATKANDARKSVTKKIPNVGVPSVAKNISGAAMGAAEELAHQFGRTLIPALNQENPYRHVSATVRIGSDLAKEEINIIDKRLPIARKALSNFLGEELPEGQDLRIGFCGSGGGYRAMLSTTGFLVGAEKLGILDTALYMSALSGSTWALGPWITMNVPINDFQQQLISKTQGMVGPKGNEMLPPLNPTQFKKFMKNLKLKYLFKQPITSVDLWGALIGNKLFSPWDNRQQVHLSNQRNMIGTGKLPFPIYTAVNPRGGVKYYWFEFTPYEIGSPDIKAFAPTWAFGRRFKKGTTPSTTTHSGNEYAPEQSLPFYLGIFGSAYTVNLEEIIDMMQKSEDATNEDVEKAQLNIAVAEQVVGKIGVKNLQKFRLSPAEINNFTYQMPDAPLEENKTIKLVDAGLAFNNPIPPLMRPERNIDVIFIFDASGDIGRVGEFKKAVQYLKENDYDTSEVNFEVAEAKAFSIHRVIRKNDNKTISLVNLRLNKDESIPAIKNDPMLQNFNLKECNSKGACSTFNFGYTEEEAKTLMRLTELIMTSNQDKIKEEFKEMISLKYS